MKSILFVLIIFVIVTIFFSIQEEDKDINPSINVNSDRKVHDINKTQSHEQKNTLSTKESVAHTDRELKPFIRNILESKDINIDEESPEKMEELKKIHNMTFYSIYKEIKKIPLCLEDIKTKEEAIECTKDLALLQSAIPLSFDLEPDHDMKYDFSKWNKDSKVEILDELEIISFRVKELEECINTAVTKVNKRECLAKQNEDTGL